MSKLKDLLRPSDQAGKEQQKKIAVYFIVGTLFIMAMWLIFSPKKKEVDKEDSKFNTEMPAPTNEKLIDDKSSTYKQLNKKKESIRDDIRDISNRLTANSDERFNLEPPSSSESSDPHIEKIETSTSAYKEMNNRVNNFYVKPDREKENMKAEIERLKGINSELAKQEVLINSNNDDPLALLEKSYELAAKYNNVPKKEEVAPKEDKPIAMPVSFVTHNVVSSLTEQTSSRGFITAIGKENKRQERNAIIACVHNKQTITNGKSVRFRLLEPMQVGRRIIPKNTLITGVASIRGDRLGVEITSLEHNKLIMPIELVVYDIDGQEGILIPKSMEVNAIKDITSNIGENLGTAVSISNQSAGEQLLSELGKDIIEGTSKYISNKIKVVKVHLKPDYKIMFVQKKD